MTKFLHRSLTNDVLLKSPGLRYEGRVQEVVPQQVLNKWKYTKEEVVPVITFEDGWQWIPNLGARRTLTDAWGAETDNWVGRRMAVQLVIVVRTEKTSGRAVERHEKRAEPLAHVRPPEDDGP